MLQRYGSKKHPNNRCLGYRPINEKGEAQDFVWQSYLQVENRISEFGSGLLSCSEITKLEKGSHIGIYSKNRPEWVIAEQGKYNRHNNIKNSKQKNLKKKIKKKNNLQIKECNFILLIVKHSNKILYLFLYSLYKNNTTQKNSFKFFTMNF